MTDAQGKSASDDERDDGAVDIVPLDDAGMHSPLDIPAFEDLVRPVKLKRRRPSPATVIAALVTVMAVVAVIAGVVVLKPFSAVRSSDYSAAAQQASTMARQYRNTSTSIDEALKFLYSQDASYDASKVKALKTQAAKLGRSVDAFADLRAMNDADIAAAYSAYATQARHFVRLSENLADSAEPLSTMVSECGKTPSATMYDDDFTAKYEQYISTCKTAAGALDNVKAQVVSEFSATLIKTLDQMDGIIGQMQQIGSPSLYSSTSENGKLLQELSTQLVDLDTSYGAVNTFQEQLRQTRENADPTALLNKLDAAIQQGYQGGR